MFIKSSPPKVSVIVAIYNAENTLRRCLDSLSNQTIKDIEFILVDDGSNDSSWDICKEYAQKDARYRIYHKENEGVSATRQFGLDRATGEYVIHLDADDYVDPRIYAEMYEKALEEKADIVFVDILRLEYEGKATLMKNGIRSWAHKDVLDSMIFRLFGSLCNRLVKRDLFEKYDIRFPEKMQYLEDKLILIKLLSRSYNAGDHLKFGYVPKPYLFYDTTANASSLTKVSDKDKFFYRLSYWENVGKELDIKVFGKTYFNLLVEYGFNVFWNHNITDEQFVSIFSKYKDDIRKYATPGSRKFLVYLASSGGYHKAEKMRWVAYPHILHDKIRIYENGIRAKMIRHHENV